MQAFPVIKDLVTDVSWNYEVKKKIPPFQPRKPEADGTWRMYQYEIDRVQEFRKCIECYLCQNVCHVLRDHEKKEAFAGPRFLVHVAALEMHPLDTRDRTEFIREAMGVGFWILPRFGFGAPRGNERLIWASFAFVNAGILLVASQLWVPIFLLAGRAAELTGIVLYILGSWRRIKPAPGSSGFSTVSQPVRCSPITTEFAARGP